MKKKKLKTGKRAPELKRGKPVLVQRVVSVLAELEEMYRRANQWEKPYADYPGKWTREASHVACPIIAKIMRLIERRKAR